MTKTEQTFKDEYLAMCIKARQATTLAEQASFRRRAWRVVDKAERAGVDLYPHVIDLDEQARMAR